MATLNATNLKHASSSSNNIVLAADGSVSMPNSSFGKIVQVVTAELSSQASVTGTTHVDTGITASITPTSASNKIFVEYNINFYSVRTGSGNYQTDASIQVLRGSTVILPPYSYGNSPQSTGSGYGHGDYHFSSGANGVVLGTFARFRHGFRLIDSPNTTSSTTYKLQFAIGYGGTFYINKTDSASQTPKSNIILMEIAA
tara:strand:- start:420 stop:1019 length:600 start_codon:yes stop_codon:yes gene_type:complete